MSLRRTIARSISRVEQQLNLMFARKLIPSTERTMLALAGNTSRGVRRRAAAADRANTEQSLKFGALNPSQARVKAFLDSTDDKLLNADLLEYKAKLSGRVNVLTKDQVRQLELHIADLEAKFYKRGSYGAVRTGGGKLRTAV